MGYLHLYYANYMGDMQTPMDILNSKKNQILINAQDRIRQALPKAQKAASNYKEDIENLYGLSPEDFIIQGMNNSDMNSLLNAYDAAAKGISYSIEHINTEDIITIAGIKEQINNLLEITDQILLAGLKTKGLANGAINKAGSYAQNILELMNSLPNLSNISNKDAKKIADSGKRIFASLSGSLLEIAIVVGYMSATEKGLNSVMLATGGLGSSVCKVINDPKMQQTIEDINNEISNVESIADLVTVSKSHVRGTVDTATFQAKNYSNIGNITVSSYKTYEDLLIGSYFNDWDFLVNTAGAFGYNHTQNFGMRPKVMIPYWRQGDIDQVWAGVREQMNLLGAADAIAHAFDGLGLTESIDYYIIRDRNTGFIKLVSVYDILEQWKEKFSTWNKTYELTRISESGAASREQFWKYNKDAFSYTKNSQERSNEAYPLIKNAILNKKVSVSLNFKLFN